MRPTPLHSDTVLIADDEPYNLEWLVDWIHAQGYKTVVAETVDAAIAQLTAARFRTVIADLNIPALPPRHSLEGKDPLYQIFPGLMVADFARNHDHTARQVVVYSVHDDPEVREMSDKLGFSYLLKGRPRTIKQEIANILIYDPRSS